MLNKGNIWKIVGIGSLCLFLLGCREESFFLTEEESLHGVSDKFVISQSENVEQKEESKISDEQNEDISSEQFTQNNEVGKGVAAEKEIVVHICGAVNQPGVYFLTENQRLYEGIHKAGGFREDADEDYLNQALLLEDGMKIVVPTMEETAQLKKADETISAEESFLQKGESAYRETKESADGKVNLNTADEALLCTLPGIGESRAKSIIAYRKEHGAFQKTEDVMKVSGIKEAAFTKIKEYVTVSE